MNTQLHEWLGKQARDKITGYEGIIVTKVDSLFGCTQFGIAGQVYNTDKKERAPTEYFDEGRIVIIGPGIRPDEVQSASGNGPDFNSDLPKH